MKRENVAIIGDSGEFKYSKNGTERTGCIVNTTMGDVFHSSAPPVGRHHAQIEIFEAGEAIPWAEGSTFDKQFIRIKSFLNNEAVTAVKGLSALNDALADLGI